MEIRHTQRSDLPVLLEIFAGARRFMAENGNPNQWGDHTPTRETLEQDIAAGCSYVCIQDGCIAATFFLSTAGEPTYRVIREGAPHRGGRAGPRRGGVLSGVVSGAVRQHPH